MNRLIFFDTETTQFDKPEICQLAMYAENTGVMFSSYFKPVNPITFEAMAVNHITNEMVVEGHEFSTTAVPEHVNKQTENGCVYVAHNAKFDARVFAEYGIILKDYICTLKVAKYLFQTDESFTQFNLQYLRYRLGLQFEDDIIAHDATSDVWVLRAIYMYLHDYIKKKADCDDARVIERFIQITKTPLKLHKCTFGNKHKGKLWSDIAFQDRGYLEWIKKTPDFMADEDIAFTVNHYLTPR